MSAIFPPITFGEEPPEIAEMLRVRSLLSDENAAFEQALPGSLSALVKNRVEWQRVIHAHTLLEEEGKRFEAAEAAGFTAQEATAFFNRMRCLVRVMSFSLEAVQEGAL